MLHGQYIKHIRIDSLWNGKRPVDWELRPDVNILSGVNGVGKSTILNRVVRHLTDITKQRNGNDGVHLTYFPDGANTVDFDFIRSIDHPAISADLINKITDNILHSELDFNLYLLQRRYLDYQVNLSTRMLELFAIFS